MSENSKQGLVEITYNGEKIMVSQEVADYLEDCRRDAHRQLMKKSRNHAAVKCEENFVEGLMAAPPIGFEDELIMRLEQERLPELIALLPEKQNRRLTAYYYEGLTYQEIAACEGVDHRAVMRSVESALKKLKIFFE